MSREGHEASDPITGQTPRGIPVDLSRQPVRRPGRSSSPAVAAASAAARLTSSAALGGYGGPRRAARPDKLASVAAEIAEDGGQASTYPCDIRSEETVAATVAAILKAHSRIDCLVNNAGGQFVGAARGHLAQGLGGGVRTNLTGGFLMARECYTQWMRATPARSSTSSPTCGTACRAWATPARRGRA